MPNGNDGPQQERLFVIIVEGEVRAGHPAVEDQNLSALEGGRLYDARIMRLRNADGCGHVLHTAQEIGGRCGVCGRLLCSRPECSGPKAACAICGKCTCGRCRRRMTVGGKKDCVVCVNCRWRAILSNSRNIARWIAVAIVLLLLLGAFL